MSWRAIILLITVVIAATAYGQNSNSCFSAGEVRLVDGSNEREGRVEVCVGGQWGTVCDDLWDQRDADVVCQRLGLESSRAIATVKASFGEGSGSIVLDGVECEGSEANLLLCPHEGLGTHDCTHAEDAGVICPPMNYTCTSGELRLVDGDAPNSGRLEICLDNQFGTICDDGWGKADATVACHQLGFSRTGAIGVTRTHPFGKGIGTIHMTNVECRGNEPDLLSCVYDDPENSCDHDDDAGVICQPLDTPTVCNDTEVRLVGGRSAAEGRLEICYNNHWGTVCDDLWDAVASLPNGQVVCRQLGFSTIRPKIIGIDSFDVTTAPIFLDNIFCRGDEENLDRCSSTRNVGDTNCDHSEDIALACYDPSQNCTEGAVRLVGGTGGREYEGRVEVCRDNHWGTVCHHGWDNKDAAVVCNSLGFPGRSLALPQAFYGIGHGIIWASQLDCTGTEDELLDCPHDTRFSSCSHLNDASVICTAPANETLPSECENGDLRLVNGSVPNEGRVELCFHGHWGTVCSDTWSNVDAAVVCKELGFQSEGALAIKAAGLYGEGSGPTFLSRVHCTGNESSLLECASQDELGQHLCASSQDAGVICPANASSKACENGEVRLRGGSAQEGRVELCINSVWGTVCVGNDDVIWDSNDAMVVCRQLGHDPDTIRGIPTFGSFGEGSGPIFLTNVGCFGTERNLLECQSSGVAIITSCNHAQDVGVVCSAVPCSPNSLRLNSGDASMAGSNSTFGRLEVCVGGSYGTVNSIGFDQRLGAAACSQLGFQDHGFQLLRSSSFFGRAEGNVYSLSLSASGELGAAVGVANASHDHDIGIICQREAAVVCSPGDVRLVGGATPTEGRVEACLDNRWGTVCDDSWDTNSAAVVCKQLGLPHQGAAVKYFGGNENLSILFDDVKCVGSESNILECWRVNLGRKDCTHLEDVGVACQGGGGLTTSHGPQDVTTTGRSGTPLSGLGEGTTSQSSVTRQTMAVGTRSGIIAAVAVPVSLLVVFIAILFTISLLLHSKTRSKDQDVEVPRSLLRSKGSLTSSSDGSKLSPQDTPQHGRYLDSSDGGGDVSPQLTTQDDNMQQQPKQYTLTSKERASSSSILELVNMNGTSNTTGNTTSNGHATHNSTSNISSNEGS